MTALCVRADACPLRALVSRALVYAAGVRVLGAR